VYLTTLGSGRTSQSHMCVRVVGVELPFPQPPHQFHIRLIDGPPNSRHINGRQIQGPLLQARHSQRNTQTSRMGWWPRFFCGEVNHTSESKILNKVKEIAKVHSTIKDHIPELLWHHTSTNPTFAIREALGVAEPTTGGRVLYTLVFRKLHPITKLRSKDLFDVWYQCFQCMYFCHIMVLSVDIACRPRYFVEGRSISSRCQSWQPAVV
jgi:hypothetical protein